MSQRNAAADARRVGKPATSNAAEDKKGKKGSAGKVLSVIIIVLLLAVCGYESYLLFGGNNFQATLAVITQGRSFLDIADEELLRQKQNAANEQADIDRLRQDLTAGKTTLDKRQKSLDTREEELDAREADLDSREQAVLEPQLQMEEFVSSLSKMDDALAAATLMAYADMSKALSAMRGLKDTKRASILNAMATVDPSAAAKFAEQLQP